MARGGTATKSSPTVPSSSGSRSSPESLHQRYFTDLVRTAALMTDDRFVAEEIVQEAFTELVARWDRLDHDRALGYLYRSVSNGARSTLRRRRTARTHRLEAAPNEPGADAAVLRAAGHDALLRAVSRLPVRQRQVLVLRYFAELSIAETAAALGLSGPAVTAATHRAVAALSEHREEFRA